MSHLPPGPGYSGHQLHHQQQPQQQSYTSSSAAPRSGPSSSTIHDRASATASTSAGVVANAAIHGRRVTSNSSIASSGTAYSASTSARGSVQHGASGMGSARAAHMETTVTKLLVATKQLLEGLTDWSQGRISEEQVSDIYVRLGNSFNAAVAAFTKEGISMRDLKEVPQLLRVRLEAAINEEASTATLNEHLPKIRPIILDLLRGLREKQDQHQAMLAAAAAERERLAAPALQPIYASDQYPQQTTRQGSLSSGQSGASGYRGPDQSRPSASQQSSMRASTSSAGRRESTDRRNTPLAGNGRISPAPSLDHPANVQRTSSRTGYHQGSYSESDMQSSGDGRRSTESTRSARKAPSESTLLGPEGSTGRRPSNTPHPGSLVKSRSNSSLRPSTSRTHSQSDTEASPSDAPLPPIPRHLESPTETTFPPHEMRESPQARPPLPLPGMQSMLSPPLPGMTATPPLPRIIQSTSETKASSSAATPMASSPPANPPSAFSTPPRSALRPMRSVEARTSAKTSEDPNLEALKKADPLARRASKRFSQYTFNKMATSASMGGASSPASSLASALSSTGLTPVRAGATMERDTSARDFINTAGRMDSSSSNNIPRTANRESSDLSSSASARRSKSRSSQSPRMTHQDSFDGVPAVPALPAMTQDLSSVSFGPDGSYKRNKRVSVVTEETEDQLEAAHSKTTTGVSSSDVPEGNQPASLHPDSALEASAMMRSDSAASAASSASRYSEGASRDVSAGQDVSQSFSESAHQPPASLTVFLQLGRDVKKTRLDLDPPPSFANLKMLFTDKFAYNPGMADFPAIYLRDPTSGVQYELEDISEIKEHSVLSLNIEPLDQVKQHIDEGLSSLAKEIKEIKLSLESSRRMSMAVPAPQGPPVSDKSPVLPPSPRQAPTESQLQTAAQQVIEMKRKLSTGDTSSGKPSAPLAAAAHSVELVSPTTSTQSTSEARVLRMANDLKVSFEEIQNARREIGILRQVYADFKADTTSMLGSLKSQTDKVKDLANTQVAGSRVYIDTGKAKLDQSSQDLLTKIEELQDIIDDLKNDVTTRRIRPKPQQMDNIKKLIDARQAELSELGKYINTVKPMWKKTWETELQNIVDEQGLLNHQEELLADLQSDHESVVTIFGQLQQYLALRQGAKGRKSEYRPPSPEQGHGGLKTVMLEVKGLQPDPDKRLKAIEQAEKARQRDASSKTNEFANELGGFVEKGKLRKTGGAEEAERIRQLRSEASFKAMFNSPFNASPFDTPKSSGTATPPDAPKVTPAASAPAALPATSAPIASSASDRSIGSAQQFPSNSDLPPLPPSDSGLSVSAETATDTVGAHPAAADDESASKEGSASDIGTASHVEVETAPGSTEPPGPGESLGGTANEMSDVAAEHEKMGRQAASTPTSMNEGLAEKAPAAPESTIGTDTKALEEPSQPAEDRSDVEGH